MIGKNLVGKNDSDSSFLALFINFGKFHYTYDKTGYLADSTEIENDHKNKDCQQASCKEEEVLRPQALELHRPAYTLVDFKCCHRLTGRNFSG